MTRLEYELLREEMPWLKLPHFDTLHHIDQDAINLVFHREMLIQRRAARLIAGEVPIPYDWKFIETSLSQK